MNSVHYNLIFQIDAILAANYFNHCFNLFETTFTAKHPTTIPDDCQCNGVKLFNEISDMLTMPEEGYV